MIRLWNKVFITALSIGVVVLPALVFAEDGGYVNLVRLPGLENSSTPNIPLFVESLFRIIIIAAALTAVVKLIIAGAKYVLSDIVTSKEEGKKDARGAIIGLLIILASVVILNEINSDLTQLPKLEGVPNIPEQPGVENPIDKVVEEICNTETGGCTKTNCAALDSHAYAANELKGNIVFTLLAYPASVIEYALNNTILAGSCEVVCAAKSGAVRDGTCSSPNDPKAVEAFRENLRQELVDQGIQAKTIVLTQITSENRSNFNNDITDRPDLKEENIIGVFELTAQDNVDLFSGDSEFKEYRSVLTKLIKESCTNSGGEGVISTSQFSGGTRYYCTK